MSKKRKGKGSPGSKTFKLSYRWPRNSIQNYDSLFYLFRPWYKEGKELSGSSPFEIGSSMTAMKLFRIIVNKLMSYYYIYYKKFYKPRYGEGKEKRGKWSLGLKTFELGSRSHNYLQSYDNLFYLLGERKVYKRERYPGTKNFEFGFRFPPHNYSRQLVIKLW